MSELKGVITAEFYDNERSIAIIRMVDAQHNNALSPAFVDELKDKIEKVLLEKKLKVMVFMGLESIFCSGADMTTLKNLCEGSDIKPTDILLPRIILNIPVVTISAMAGHAIGGGLALGVAMDMAIISKESRYGCTFMNMGFTPGMGVTKLLEHVMSPAMANEMLFLGDCKKGKEFIGCSGFNYILDKQQVEQKAIELAMGIAEKTKLSLELLKSCLSLSRKKAFEDTFLMESSMHTICFAQSETKKIIEENYVT